METALRQTCAPSWNWCLRRNPLYLLSAACMALGARKLLVSPTATPAGEVELILLTLGALQLYEWGVTGVLLLLHRTRRSPEDEPSLLLVAVLFWTGPLVATMEMSAQRASAGIILAAGACAVALAEMAAVRRMMGWRFSLWGQLLAAGSLVLVAAAQPLMKIPDAEGTPHDLLLYALWWALAAIGLLAVPAVRAHPPAPSDPLLQPEGPSRHMEVGLILAALAAGATHLWAMNHAFFAHARPFYAAPLLIVVAAGAIEFAQRLPRRGPWILASAVWMPALAIVLATARFDRDFPIADLPRVLQDPLLPVLALAGAAWGFGYVRHRWELLAHAAVAALAVAGVRAFMLFNGGDAGTDAPEMRIASDLTRAHAAAGLYALTAYLLLLTMLKRSRATALLALVVQQAALTTWVYQHSPGENMIVALSGAWSLLLGMHIADRRPPLTLRALPILALVAACWYFERYPALYWLAKGHAAAMTGVLFAIGMWQPWTRYRDAAVLAGIASQSLMIARWVQISPQGKPALIIAGAFALLAAGAMVSWHKSHWLMPDPAPPDDAPLAGPDNARLDNARPEAPGNADQYQPRPYEPPGDA